MDDRLQTKRFNRFSVTHGLGENKSATIVSVEAKPKSKIWMDRQLNNIN